VLRLRIPVAPPRGGGSSEHASLPRRASFWDAKSLDSWNSDCSALADPVVWNLE